MSIGAWRPRRRLPLLCVHLGRLREQSSIIVPHFLELVAVRQDHILLGTVLKDVILGPQRHKVGLHRILDVVVWTAALHFIELGEGALKLVLQRLVLERKAELQVLRCTVSHVFIDLIDGEL